MKCYEIDAVNIRSFPGLLISSLVKPLGVFKLQLIQTEESMLQGDLFLLPNHY